MSTLPKGWVSTTVKDLAGTSGLFVDGDWVESKDQDPNGDIRLLQLADIGDGVFLDKSDRWINEEAFTRLRCTELETGDVLIARMPDPLGRACLMPSLEQRCVTVVDVAALRVDPLVADNRWTMHTVNAPQLRAEINSQASGTTRKRISRGNLGGLQIPLPPESEQKRIADKLNTVLTRVDAVNSRLARVAPILKRFRQSVLGAATSGRLTEDWRSAAKPNAAWACSPTPLRNHAQLDVGFAFKSSEFEDQGVRLLRGDNIEPGALRWRDAKHWPVSRVDLDRHTFLSEGDLILAMDRPVISTGLKVARVEADDLPCLLVQRVCRFRLTGNLAAGYLYAALRSLAFVDHLVGVQNGSSIPHISASQILSFELAIPDLEEQTEIVRRVETLFAFADRLEARLQTARTATERLTPALLAKAFRGELVPQDPNDEPASELLKRLAATAPASTPKRGRSKASTAT